MPYKNIKTQEVITSLEYLDLTITERLSYVKVDESSKNFLISAAIGAATGSSILGGLLGGDILGGVAGDLLNGDLFD